MTHWYSAVSHAWHVACGACSWSCSDLELDLVVQAGHEHALEAHACTFSSSTAQLDARDRHPAGRKLA